MVHGWMSDGNEGEDNKKDGERKLMMPWYEAGQM